VETALAGGDAHAVEAVGMFCAMLGTVAGNLALTLGSRGGVYIAGGIVPKLGALFDGELFRQRFEAKGRFAPAMARVPTVAVLHPHAGLLGAAAFAVQADPGARVSAGRDR
jgi:glucokinase